MDNISTTPEYLFESSWEVCNKVGGIYTVLSTKAHTLQQSFKDKLIFIGPDVWANTNAPDFIEDDVLFADWRAYTKTTENLKVKVGRWNVPGKPPVILVDFKPFFKERDSFFYSMWESFRVDSIHAYGDYDESCIFPFPDDFSCCRLMGRVVRRERCRGEFLKPLWLLVGWLLFTPTQKLGTHRAEDT